jgi:hypothetical protein
LIRRLEAAHRRNQQLSRELTIPASNSPPRTQTSGRPGVTQRRRLSSI